VSEYEDTGRLVLRTARPDDAIALMKLKQRLDEETSFMLLEPSERDPSIQALTRHLEEMNRSENSVVIVADRRGDLAGYVELIGGKFRRNRSTTHVVIVKASALHCWRRQSAGRLPAACAGSSST
jgi:hypothetical protein